MRTNSSGAEMNLEVLMRRQPGQWIRDELCARLRAAGLSVGTESDPDDLTVIDDTYISLQISEIKRWGGVGCEVDLGHFDTFKTDRYGKLDFDAIMPALRKRVKEEKARQTKHLRLFWASPAARKADRASWRQNAIALWRPTWKGRSPSLSPLLRRLSGYTSTPAPCMTCAPEGRSFIIVSAVPSA